MPPNAMSQVIRNLRSVALRRDEAGLTDGQLLECFLASRDEAAFEALVRRHGPMVLGVCRRLLGHDQDAEDAFQATFLVLAHKAASIQPRQMVANWLHGVAHNTALKARASSMKRRRREKQVSAMPEPELRQQVQDSDLHRVLDRALRSLTDTYRVPIILCELEGKTYKEAARQLGVTESTISVRLVRARKMLAKRLAGKGVALSAGSLGLLLSPDTASASVPATLLTSTVKAASLAGLGQAVAMGTISGKVAALTQGVLKSMLLTKLKIMTALLLVVGIVGTSAGLLNYQSQAATPAGATPIQTTAAVTSAERVTASSNAEQVQAELAQLQGTWNAATGGEFKGKQEPKEDVTIAGHRFVISGSAFQWFTSLSSEPIMQGTLAIDPNKRPKTMDLIFDGETMARRKSNASGKCIYQLDGDTLIFCYGDVARPTEFRTSEANPDLRLYVWKRAKPQEKPSEAAAKEQEKLQGRWQAIAGETAREKMPAAVVQEISMTLAGTKVTLGRRNERGSGKCTIDPTKTPKTIDLVMDDGSQSIGIYELDKDRLKLCVVESKGAPRPTEFVARDDQVVVVFQRVEPGKTEPAQEKQVESPTPGERVLREEVAALRAQLKFQEAVVGRLKDELVVARKEVSAVLKKVDIAKNTIDVTLGGTTLKMDAIPLATSAKFYLDGKECSINDLKEGMSISLAFGTDAEKSQVVAVRASTSKANQEKR